MQAKIVELEQQNKQLAKELEETSGKQVTQSTSLSDTDTQLKTSLTTLQEVATRREQQIAALKQQTSQQAGQMQELSHQQQKASTEIQNQLKNITDSHSTQITEHDRLLGYVVTQIEKLKTDFTEVSSDHSKQFENLDKKRRVLVQKVNGMASQHQTDLESLREDVEAAPSQDQVLNIVKASTQRELSNLRRDVNRLQDNIQTLQSRRRSP